MELAARINAYLTPARRQAVYQIIGVIGIVLTALSPAMSTQVAQWTQVLFALGAVGSLILAAIMTRAPQWPAIYSGMAALVAALVSASLITSGAADLALRLVQAAITVAPLIVILARTDTSTPSGTPAAEVVAAQAFAPLVPPVESASTTAIGGKAVYNPGNGDEPTTSTL